jgi:hypothetical protein
MRYAIWVMVGALALGGCGPRIVSGTPVPRNPNGRVAVRGGNENRGGGIHGRSIHIPPGHYPPPGECRIWYPSSPPGHQPPPGRCERLVGRVPFGAFLLYNDRAWDTEYDWRREESRRPGSVPVIVLKIMRSLVRN